MATAHVLGIDFGTTNSYYAKCPGDQISPIGVDFGWGRDGLASAILYRDDSAPLVGDEAVQERGGAEASDRANYRLRTDFKPDIAASDEARGCAADFLKGVLVLCKERHIDVDPSSRQVILGVPSEAEDKFKNKLRAVAEEAGYGAVLLVDEPIGALLSHMWRKDLTPAEAHKGVLVVDFGGGTCDFAFLRGLKVEHSWGDMSYGGRLFDDLFFQWFVDENPGLLARLEEKGDEYYVHWLLCREAKEAFSRRMEKGNEKVTLRLDGHGNLRGALWDEFVCKSAAYRPTEPFLRYLRETKQSEGRLAGGSEPIDLIGWFRGLLSDGLEERGIDRSRVRRVILAGGSSQWRFVGDIVREVLNLEPAEMLRSDRPYAVVAEGLAILPALQRSFAEKQSKMREELPGFLERELVPFVLPGLERATKGIAENVTSALYDERIAPILRDFRGKGGSVASLKERIASEAAAFEPELRKIVDVRFAHVMDRLPSDLEKVVGGWFDSHGLHYSPGGLRAKRKITVTAGADSEELIDPFGPVMAHIAAFAAGVGAWLMAAICGGGGLALIASGPIGWIIGLIISAGIVYLTWKYGLKKAKEIIEGYELPSWVVKGVVREGTMKKVRRNLKGKIEAELTDRLAEVSDDLQSKLTKRIEMEIDALSEIDQL